MKVLDGFGNGRVVRLKNKKSRPKDGPSIVAPQSVLDFEEPRYAGLTLPRTGIQVHETDDRSL